MRNSGSSPGLLEHEDSFKDKKIIVYNYFPWFTCSVLVFCMAFEYYANLSLPSSLGRGPLTPDKFSVDNAKVLLKGLTDLGPRITGSHVTEIETPKYLLGVLEKIKAGAPDNVIIELDEQHPSSNFYIDFLGGINNVYDGVTNIVAKISWKDSNIHPTSPEAILINAHFDSVPGSPGGSDDGVGVACMLEALRALAHGPKLHRPVMFLFNGAEESNHQAAHGFISQHKWAPEVKFLINLEAIGAGGHEMVFQCNSGWLARHYAKMAPHPHSQVVAHELFKNFLYRVASTDWSTLIKYGRPGMMGIDTAYIENGFVYHTTFDTIDKIPDGTYLNTGENILQMSRSLSTVIEIPDFQMNSKVVVDNTIDTSLKLMNRYQDEHAVFVDFLGLYMFVYSGFYVTVYHAMAVVFGLFTVFILSHHVKNLTFGLICSLLLDKFIGIWLPTLLTGIVGLFYYFVCPMRWYAGGVTVAIIMYCPVAMFNSMIVRAYLTTRSHNAPILRQIAAILMNALISIPFIILDVMSAYVWCQWVVFVSGASLVQLYVKQYYQNSYPIPDPSPKAASLSTYPHAVKTFGSFASSSNLARSSSTGNMKRTLSTNSVKDAVDCQTTTVAMINHHAGRYLYSPEFYYVVTVSPTILLWVQTIHLTFTLLIPLLGKSGTTTPSDPLLGLLFGLLIALPAGCVLINDIQRPLAKSTIQSCFGALLVGFVIVSVIFRSSYSDLRPKRLWIQHVERHTVIRETSSPGDALFTPQPVLVKSVADKSLVDYGLWVNAFDSNGMAPLKSLPALDVESRDTTCSNANGDCYYDFPWYFPVAEALKDSVYLPTAERPLIPDNQRLQMKVTAQILSNEVCHRFKCERRIQSLVDENEFMYRVISVSITGPSHMNLVVRDRARGKRIPYWKINGGATLEDMVTPPVIRADGVHYFTLGFGMCAEGRCTASLTLIVKGADKVDFAGYGQYVDIIDNKEVRSFIRDLPTWSKGAEWTNFPSIIIRDSV